MDDAVNALTAGGKIFISKKMYEFCSNDGELACIIGHEISHNELGHINNQINRTKTIQNFGLSDDISSLITSTLYQPFNKKNESHCDMLGIDLAISSGYDPCSSIQFWKRMKSDERELSQIENILSSHPYSNQRINCSINHIKRNYNLSCVE